MARTQRLPRSLIPLAILLVAAAAWLVLLEGRDGTGTAPAPPATLVPFPPDSVVAVTIRGPDRDVLLTRADGLWRLEGQLVDYADPGNAGRLVQALCGEAPAPLPPGPERDGGRYGLAPGRALRVEVAHRDGRRLAFDLGAINPVTGRAYALGADRGGTFTVEGTLAESLAGVPGILRLRKLWPQIAADTVDTLRLRRSGPGEADLAVRDPDGRWWLRPAAADVRPGRVLLAYRRHYDDRRRERDGAAWYLAEDRQLREILFHMHDAQVRSFWTGRPDAGALARAGLRPPVAAIRAAGRFPGSPLVAAFGLEEEEGGVAATRAGADGLLVVDASPRTALLEPLAAYLEVGVLDFPFARVDSFAFGRLGGPAWTGGRADLGWRATLVDPPAELRRLADNFLRDLALHLERLEIVDALAPRPDADPLDPGEEYAVTLWRRDAPVRELRLGRLATDAGPVAAAWQPAGGKLLAIDGEFLVTLRAMTQSLEKESR